MANAPRPIGAADLILREFPPLCQYLPPLLVQGQIGLIYAATGVGKTLFSLPLAAAAASGEGQFLKWSTHTPARVLYLDGEMTLQAMQRRLMAVAQSISFDFDNAHLQFLSCDMFGGCVPNISVAKDQAFYTDLMREFDVLIIDNLCSCAARIDGEPDTDTWNRVRPWLIRLRGMNKAVIIVHHAGKGGDQLGTSEKTQVLNWIVRLARPADYSAEQGARMDLTFEKVRDLWGEKDAEPLSVQCLEVDGKQVWTWEPAATRREVLIRDMHGMGMGVREIAESIRCSTFAVRRVLNQVRMEERVDEEKQEAAKAARWFE